MSKRFNECRVPEDGSSIIFLIVWLVLVLVFLFLISGNGEISLVEKEYIVDKDDTLYGIAYKYCPDTMDTRKYVHKLKEINNIKDSIINPNEEIRILVVK